MSDTGWSLKASVGRLGMWEVCVPVLSLQLLERRRDAIFRAGSPKL